METNLFCASMKNIQDNVEQNQPSVIEVDLSDENVYKHAPSMQTEAIRAIREKIKEAIFEENGESVETLLKRHKHDLDTDTFKELIVAAITYFSVEDQDGNIRDSFYVVKLLSLLSQYKDELRETFKELLVTAIKNFGGINKNGDCGDARSAIKLLEKYKNDLGDTFKELTVTAIKNFSGVNQNLYGGDTRSAMKLLEKYGSYFDKDTFKELIVTAIKNFSDLDKDGNVRDSDNAMILLDKHKNVLGDAFKEFIVTIVKNFCFIGSSQIGPIKSPRSAIEWLGKYKSDLDKDTFEELILTVIGIFLSGTISDDVRGADHAITLLENHKNDLGKDIFKTLAEKAITRFSGISQRGDVRDARSAMKLLKICVIQIDDSESLKSLIAIAYKNMNLDLAFNHINNTSGSILTLINNMQDKSLKTQCMENAIEYLNTQNISTIKDALEDILYSDPIYLKSNVILKFCIDKLLKQKIIEAGSKAVKFKGIELNILLDYIESLSSAEEFMLENSSLINQMIYFGRVLEEHNGPNGRFTTLENQYFKIKQIEETKLSLEDICSYDDEDLIFISRDFQRLKVSREYYQRWGLGNSNSKIAVTDAFHYDQNNENIKINNPDELFKTFKVFQHVYDYHNKQASFAKLLDILNLGEYQEQFKEALNHSEFSYDLTSDKHQANFVNIFGKFVEDGANLINLTGESALNIKITEEHFNNIMEVYNKSTADNAEKAQTLLCLSALFVKYSSSKFFGMDDNSITSLRNYALALLNKAVVLDSTIVNPENLNEWKNRITGNFGTFSCTAVLSNMMIEEITVNFPTVLSSMLPPAWC